MLQNPDSPFIQYIANKQHYDDVIGLIGSVKKTLWIGTEAIPLLSVLASLIRRGVGIRLFSARKQITTLFVAIHCYL